MAQELAERMETTLSYWQTELDRYNAANLLQGYDESSWTLGQVYAHVTYSGVFFFKQAKRCLEAPVSEIGLSAMGESLFERDSFPQMKIRIPQQYEHVPKQPADQSEILKALQLNFTMAHAVVPFLADAPEDQRLKHPIFGWLNARQWFLMAVLHYEHHRRQKGWIDAVIFKHDA